MKWISVEDRLPEEETEMNTLWFDVWIVENESCQYREIATKSTNGAFYEQVLDSDGDISHHEELENVTHWLLPEPPNKLDEQNKAVDK